MPKKPRHAIVLVVRMSVTRLPEGTEGLTERAPLWARSAPQNMLDNAEPNLSSVHQPLG